MYIFDRYHIKTKIGSGGMADILGAYDPLFEREVAIKVIKADLSKNPRILERFKLEAQIMASLAHEGIVPIYDFGAYKGKPYLVMRLMSGGSLTARIEQRPLSLSEAAQLLARLAPALDMAHQKGVIHRDLKPDNILLDEAGRPYIADFGIAKLIENTIQQTRGTHGPIGTPAYMSPEQIRGDKNIDGRTDIYSLGVILFQMLTGKRPYEGRSFPELVYKHLDEPVPNIRTFKPGLPAGCQYVIERAMAKNRDARYRSASEMVAELRAVSEDKFELIVVPEGKADPEPYYPPTVPEEPNREDSLPNERFNIWQRVFPVRLLFGAVIVGTLVIVGPIIIGQESGTSTPTPSPTSTSISPTPLPTSTPFIDLLARGDAYYDREEYEKALVEYNKAIDINPNNPLSYSKRGQVYYKMEEYYSAIDDFTKAIDLGLIDQLEVVYNNCGNAYRHIGEYDKAIFNHTEAIRLNPNYSRAYANRGVAYYKKQEYDKAIQDLDKAIELEESDFSRARDYNNRAKVYKTIRNYVQALADCNEAIRLDPEYSSAYNNRGSIYEDLGQFDKARADYEKVLELNQGYEQHAQEALDRLK